MLDILRQLPSEPHGLLVTGILVLAGVVLLKSFERIFVNNVFPPKSLPGGVLMFAVNALISLVVVAAAMTVIMGWPWLTGAPWPPEEATWSSGYHQLVCQEGTFSFDGTDVVLERVEPDQTAALGRGDLKPLSMFGAHLADPDERELVGDLDRLLAAQVVLAGAPLSHRPTL